jgi:D-alanyl-D-alanine carboxypeptidase/D-alanyl-D-alanine-endopeptidase (penicillin-binding protein 4)
MLIRTRPGAPLPSRRTRLKASAADPTRRAFRRVCWLAAGVALRSALALGALALAALALAPLPSVDGSNQASAAPPPSSTSSLLTTPLLSPARLPETMQDMAASRRLDVAVAAAMSAHSLGAGAAASSCAEVAQDGHVLYQDHATLPVIPASNMKLVTAAALLDKLGPSYTFQTDLRALQPPVHGIIHGNLYLVGGGDPILRLSSDAPSGPGPEPYSNIAGLVQELKTAGVHQVTGSVIGDDSRYDSLRTVPGWPARYEEEEDVGPLSALDVDDGLATAGGGLNLGAPPAVQAAGILTNLMHSAGIQVGRGPTSGQTPPGSKLLVKLVSPPLGQILGVVLRASDDTAMELMTKELGFKERGVGSTAAGTAAIRADLAADGLPLHGFVNADGSGLSRSDRVTCALLVALLERAGPNGLLVKDLPVAARSGTLVGELNGTTAAGRVYAKTGTLDDVKALSGWVEPLKGQGGGNPGLAQPVVFATVLNDLAPALPSPTDTPAGLTDRVALDVAEYPQMPALARFEP